MVFFLNTYRILTFGKRQELASREGAEMAQSSVRVDNDETLREARLECLAMVNAMEIGSG